MEIDIASNAQNSPAWAEMDRISEHVRIVPEDRLRQIAKEALARFTLECKDDQKVNCVWQSLLETFATASISQAHTTAACNALSAFLDAGLVSQNETTRQLVLRRETWLAVFDIWLARFEDTKPKPMKQVLTTLTNLLIKRPQDVDKSDIQMKIFEAILPGIVLRQQRSRIKASLVCLEIFFRKHAITPSQLVSLVGNWLRSHDQLFTVMWAEDCKALSISIARESGSSNAGGKSLQLPPEDVARVFVLSLLKQSQNVELAPSAGSVLAAYLQKAMSAPEGNEQLQYTECSGCAAIWAAPVKHIALQNLEDLESIANNVFHPIFGVDPSGFYQFINQLPLTSLLAGDMTDAPLSDYMVLFAALQVGKKIGLVHEDNDASKVTVARKRAGRTLVLKSDIIGQFLLHRESSIRIATLALLITAFSTTKPLSSAAMQALLNGLPSMHAESDSYSRGEILSLIKKLIVRLKGGVVADSVGGGHQELSEPTAGTPKPATSESASQVCLTAYFNFLRVDLQPTASYPRHITALKALALFLESGLDPRIDSGRVGKGEGDRTKWKYHLKIFSSSLLRLLLDLLLDPFEEVRATSLRIIDMFPRAMLLASRPTDTHPILLNALGRAEQLASNTSRADHADTVARLYHILFNAASRGDPQQSAPEWWTTKAGIVGAILENLEKKLSLRGGLFNATMRNAPLHGYVSALRYIVSTPNFFEVISNANEGTSQSWRSVHARIVGICDQIWLEVSPVLCIDSPEGHSDDPVEDVNVGPKDILSYSWRALRESSLLLQATLVNSTYGPKGGHGLSKADYEKIGSSSFTQLAELRHRGAFSTVSQTFATCCQRCSQSSDPGISSLPEIWFLEAKQIIFELASKLTRRSAGIPAMITGILSAQPGGSLFEQVIHELHEISRLPAQRNEASQELELPQVHAMNCLKDIYTNTKLGPHTERFIMPALTLSAERLGSPIWALRNSGLMLFRALLTRICRTFTGTGLGFGGSSGSEPGARVSFKKYPGLLELMSKLLAPEDAARGDAGTMAMVTERVFPALELIGEKIPTTGDNDDLLLKGLVLCHFGSPVWGIREHAARVYASLLNRAEILTDIRQLLDIKKGDASQNFLHGKALCIRYALRRFASCPHSSWNGHLPEVISTLRHTLSELLPLTRSPFVASTLVEVMNDTIERTVGSGHEEQWAEPLNDIFLAHGLYDVMEFLFSLNNADWQSSSTSRASSLLRRALSWTTLLKVLISSNTDDSVDLLRAASKLDPNAARWLLERTQTVLGSKETYRQQLLTLYSAVLVEDHSLIVKVAATASLSTILEDVLDFRRDVMVKDFEGPWQELLQNLQTQDNIELRSRESTDADLRLHGCLLSMKSTSGNMPLSLDSASAVEAWCTRLRFALREETEFTTRHAAVLSVSSFARALRPTGSPARVDPIYMEVYLILYDMLNDDDEELRDLAASTASWVLSYSSVCGSKAVALAPLNASHHLAQFILTSYSASSELCQKVIQYVAGDGPRISDCGQSATFTPVAILLAQLTEASTVLFVEEKQNLFIDEVRECEIWARGLRHLAGSSFDPAMTTALSRWVADGIAQLNDMVASEQGKDSCLGWTSKPEIFTLVVRIINLAGVLAASDFLAAQHLCEDRHMLRERLRSLLERGRAALLHNTLLDMIEAALSH